MEGWKMEGGKEGRREDSGTDAVITVPVDTQRPRMTGNGGR